MAPDLLVVPFPLLLPRSCPFISWVAGYADSAPIVDAFFFFLKRKKASKDIRVRSAIPPTTPPIMGPMGVFFFLWDPIVEVEEEEEEEVWSGAVFVVVFGLEFEGVVVARGMAAVVGS